MNNEVDWSYFRADDLGEVGKARHVKLDCNGKRHYVPQSVSKWQNNGILVVEQWFARKEGLGD